MDKEQGATIFHRQICSMLYGSLDERGIWGRMDTCICMAESFFCSTETITTLLIGYNPIQNKKFKKERKKIETTMGSGKFTMQFYF